MKYPNLGYFALLTICTLGGCTHEPEPTVLPTPAEHSAMTISATQYAPLEYISTGSVVSDQRIEISSRLSGYLRQLHVKEGDVVQVGQLLAQIDAADIEGAIRQAEAVVSAARSAQQDTLTDLQHYQTLFDQHNISENDLRKAKLRLDAATESLNQATAALETAQAQRDYTEIRSAFDANVVTLNARAGDLVLPGKPILTLEADTALIFETFVPEQRLALIQIGAQVTLQLDALSKDTYSKDIAGKVIRIVRSGDPVTRSYPVKISLPNDPTLMPGMFGRAVFSIGDSPNLLLPRQSLVELGGLRGVFVVDDNDIAHFRWLRLGREWPEQVEVTAGLSTTDRLVGSVPSSLRDGDLIKPLRSESSPE